MENDPRWEEYKILQDKIDKIGAFRFQVRGWVVTLITAALVAGPVPQGVTGPVLALVPFGGLLLVFVFWCLEVEQSRNQNLLFARVRQIEVSWGDGPQLGREIVLEHGRAKREIQKTQGWSRVAWIRWFLVRQVPHSFYVLTYVFFLAGMLFRWGGSSQTPERTLQVGLDTVTVRMLPVEPETVLRSVRPGLFRVNRFPTDSSRQRGAR